MTASTDIAELAITRLKGVGPAMSAQLAKLQIYSVADLLFHLPTRYEDRTRVVPLGSLRPGVAAVFEGVIDHAEIKYTGGRGRGRSRSRRMLLCHVSDGTGAVVLRFFHFSKAQQQQLVPGTRLHCYGEARRGMTNLEVTHPEYRQLHDVDQAEAPASLTAIYPLTEKVSQGLLRSLVKQAFRHSGQQAELLPADFCRQQQLPGLMQALQLVHYPPPDISLAQLEAAEHPAQQRLVVEELLAHQLSLARVRQALRQRKASALRLTAASKAAFERSLGFSLTAAQQRVISEIGEDLSQQLPMLRLLQGDVGSGKTVVAAFAALHAIANDRQLALMVPTEILADQHYRQFMQWFPRQCLLLTGKDRGQQRADKLAHIAAGKAAIVIGTHALFQQEVQFQSLAVVVVDEQHRFGVHQRLALSDKGRQHDEGHIVMPHQLVMTATPIPRSLAMTAYADLDYSVIDELPAGRKPVTTVVLPDTRRGEVIDRIAAACEQGEQAYWVCTMIEESDVLQCQAAEETASLLADELSQLNVGLVHGRMKQAEKEAVVERFKQRQIDLLVATTVIEVGVNVPSASLMVIENPERLGLAQLHQLRGRVGRGDRQSACVLMYRAPLSENGKQRLAVLRQTTDGFVIAEKDLQLRGPGEVLGTRQTGDMQFRLADLSRDADWLPRIKQLARDMLAADAPQVKPLIRRWLGKSGKYAQV